MGFNQLKRRKFITLLGGAAAWPLAARAQQPIPVVAALGVSSREGQERTIAAFRQGLSAAGYDEGRNVVIEFRDANNRLDKLPELAADLVSRHVAVIFAWGGAAAARAAKAATSRIPIVFSIGQDPIALGIVSSLSRPDGNITGATFMATELGPKRLGLLKELVPRAARYALLVDPNAPQTKTITEESRTAAASAGREIEVFGASDSREIDAAFADLAKKGADALIVASSVLFTGRRVQIVTLAATNRIPAIYYDRMSAEIGGLMSYGARITDTMRQAGNYVGRILKGERPSDLPVVQAATFEFVLNLQTARALGLTVPPTLLALADEVIE
jgi:putative tryptophan/tyrosine transport system substrate-binding protein